ncbi:TonB-dependent receptor [Permianibacter aggregans]|uniref:Iron complex outermembrane receptor protein n=1 Tax=Permianibacter aggregans TaxID=1510150 RepID=A0A4V3D7M7_9GAMM|nr:TonB-dependent receptor [Permianibacter aggregans]QGX41053.1 TonB-dependent receptor [Permianibacter aggregans]TDQ48117.1 iron complex outermembrane receptor protein [Permianibacter aggregans]
MIGKPRHSLTLLASAIAMTFSQQTLAEPETPAQDEEEVEHIVVTASRRAEHLAEIPGTVQVLGREQLLEQAQPGQGLGDVLAMLIPSLGVSTETRTSASQTMRGRNVLVLIDGVPQNDNRDVSRHYDNLSLSHVERIEVISGASAVYGSGGTGGIINIITRRNRGESLAFDVRSGGSINTESSGDGGDLGFAHGATGREGAFDFYFGFGFESRQSAFDAEGRQIAPEPAQTSLSDTETSDMLLKVGFEPNDLQRMEFHFSRYQNEQDSEYGPNYGGPGVPVLLRRESVPVEAVAGLQLDDQPYTERQAMSVQYRHDDVAGQRLHALAYAREREFRFFPFPQQLIPGNASSIVVNQSTSYADVAGVKLALDGEPIQHWRLVYGIDYDRDEGRQRARGYDPMAFLISGGLQYLPIGGEYDYGPDVRTDKLGLFMQNHWQMTEALALRTGIRHEQVEVEVSDSVPVLETFAHGLGVIPRITPLPGAELDYRENLYNLGAVYAIDASQQWFVNYSEGFELPDTARLLRNAIAPNSLTLFIPGVRGGTVVAESELEAVKVESTEIGWRWRGDDSRLHVTAFQNRSSKTPVFNADYSVDILDQEKRIEGIESGFDAYLDQNWSLGGSAAYTRGETRDESSGDWLSLSAFEVSPMKATVYLGYQQSGYWQTRIQALHVGDYDAANRDNPREAAIDGYTVYDWLTEIELPAGALTINIRNLLNEQYQTVYSQWAQNIYGDFVGIPANGRSVALLYTLRY